MSTDDVRHTLSEHVLEIVLHRPEKRNALTVSMYQALVSAFAEAESNDDVRVLLLRGEGGHFAAGNDLADFLQNPPTGDDAPVYQFLQSLANCSKPLVVAVDGAAVGLGTTLLLHADWVLATPRARLQLPFVDLGLVPEAAATYLLPLTVGRLRAQRWLLAGQPIDPQEALAAGLITELAEPDALLERARQAAALLAKKPAAALRAAKALAKAPFAAEVKATLAREAAVFTERLQAPETKAQFAAFLNKGK